MFTQYTKFNDKSESKVIHHEELLQTLPKTRSEDDILKVLKSRRDSQNLHSDREFYIQQQYQTVIAAVKIGCDLYQIRLALRDNEVTDKLIEQIVYDKTVKNCVNIKKIKQNYFLEDLEKHREVILKLTLLLFIMNTHGDYERRNQLHLQLIDKGWLKGTADDNDIRALNTALESKLLSTITHYFDAEGPRSERFLESLPLGTLLKLLNQYESSKQKNDEVESALNIFR